MTAQPAAGHAAFDELTVGFALDALEPGEEAVLVKHLPGCVRCQDSLATHRAIAAELALAFLYDADDADDADDAGDAGEAHEVPISAALAEAMASQPSRLPADPFNEPTATTGRVPLQPSFRARPRVGNSSGDRRSGAMRQARRVLVGAGALGVIAAISLSAYDVHLRREPVPAVKGGGALSALADSGATIAHLSGHTSNASATAVVANGHAWLVSSGLAPTAKNASYVVWEFESGDRVKPLAAFSASSDKTPDVVDLGTIPTAEAGYGVTLEPQAANKPLPATPNGNTVLSELADGNVPVK